MLCSCSCFGIAKADCQSFFLQIKLSHRQGMQHQSSAFLLSEHSTSSDHQPISATSPTQTPTSNKHETASAQADRTYKTHSCPQLDNLSPSLASDISTEDIADKQQQSTNTDVVVTTSTDEFDDDLDWGQLDCDAMETSARHSIEQPVPTSSANTIMF